MTTALMFSSRFARKFKEGASLRQGKARRAMAGESRGRPRRRVVDEMREQNQALSIRRRGFNRCRGSAIFYRLPSLEASENPSNDDGTP
jgi:hypothetical protein